MKMKGFEEYEIFEDGSIHRNGRQIAQYMYGAVDYYVVSLYRDGKQCSRYVHRLVAQTFIPNLKNKPQVNHIDGNKQNNHVSNLEWVTAAYNKKHAMDNGLTKNSSGIPLEVIKYTKDGEFIAEYPSMLEAAYQNKCSYMAISNACKGKSKTCKGHVWRYNDVD